MEQYDNMTFFTEEKQVSFAELQKLKENIDLRLKALKEKKSGKKVFVPHSPQNTCVYFTLKNHG